MRSLLNFCAKTSMFETMKNPAKKLAGLQAKE